jgi:hypothetical protein
MSGERRLDRQEGDEPSPGMSFGVLCVVLFAMFAIAVNVIQAADLFGGL